MSILFKTNQEQKEYIGDKINFFWPNFRTGGYYYRRYIENSLTDGQHVLDAGCGTGGIIGEYKNRIKLLAGIDIDKAALERNKIVDQKLAANLENMPFADNIFDMVVSQFTLEHLSKPWLVFKEIFRVLKPGGVFIFITPNKHNPVIFISNILPHWTHKFLRSKLLKKEEETHHTYYRANTRAKLAGLGRVAGFDKIEIIRAGNPEYMGFCKPLVWPAIIFEKFIDNFILRVFKMYLVGCFVKKNVR